MKLSKKSIVNLINDLNANDVETRTLAINELTSVGGRAVPNLIEALQDTRWLVRGYAALTLARIGGSDFAPHIVPLLQDTEYPVREKAASALGQLGDSRALEALTLAINDDNPDVREMAAWALGNLGNPEATKALVTLLDDPYIEVSDNAIWALKQLNDVPLDPLKAALRHQNPNVRAYSAEILGHIGSKNAKDVLDLALNNEQDEFVRTVIESTLRSQK